MVVKRDNERARTDRPRAGPANTKRAKDERAKDERAEDQQAKDRPANDQRAATFAEHRRYLFAVAYRMLGVAADAEDVVQDAWLRFAAARSGEIEHPRTYLVTIVTRLCIDLQRSARRRREEYVGTWLPEPVPTEEALADDRLESAESVSFAFLLMLERLTPLQRAVLVLYEVLDYSHDEIARVVGGTVAASRQALRRARQRVEDVSLPTSAPPDDAPDLVDRFLAAARSGDVTGIMSALAPDVVLMSDGGGQVPAVRYPLTGSEQVTRFFAGISRLAGHERTVAAQLNGQPALLVHEEGMLTNAFLFQLAGDRIAAIYVVRSPAKLARLSA
ncbi:MAG: RNA polymerase sigma factor SigJ [Acidobacteriota bacterium]|jgi:RNA polymerase sigma-70 factor (ECF subfamily)